MIFLSLKHDGIVGDWVPDCLRELISLTGRNVGIKARVYIYTKLARYLYQHLGLKRYHFTFRLTVLIGDKETAACIEAR